MCCSLELRRCRLLGAIPFTVSSEEKICLTTCLIDVKPDRLPRLVPHLGCVWQSVSS